MRVLFLAHLFPLPLDSGGKIKSFHTLKALASVHDVYVIAYTRGAQEQNLTPELMKLTPRVKTVPLARSHPKQVTDALSAAIAGRSYIVSRDYRREMHRAVRQAVQSFQPEIVHIDHLQMAQFVDFNSIYKVVLDHHNVESTIIRRMAETSDSLPLRLYAGIEWPKLRRYELGVCRESDLVITVSESDKDTLASLGADPDTIESVPIGVDTDYFRPVVRMYRSEEILSLGTMYWPPNIDSVVYFTNDILPLIREHIPDCTFTIAGARPTPAVKALQSKPGVTVTGYIEDIRETARDCGVFVVPLRSGSGVRVKILNALAMGLPVVSTSVGAEGLDAVDGEHVLIADTPARFADAVVRVLQDDGLARRLAQRGRALVEDAYSWDSIGKQLLDLYRRRFMDSISRTPSVRLEPAQRN